MVKKMSRLRTAIAGYGVVGRRRHECLKRDERFEVVAIGDKDIFSVDVKKDYLKSKKLMPFDKIRKKY